MASEVPEIPHNMRRLYRRFERWRSAHTGVRLPIPQRLWRAATKQARKHGVFPTAKVLRLEYGKLKQLVEAASRKSKGPRVLLNSRQAPGGERRRNLRFLAYNPRFLIVPWVQVKHLASHILGEMARRIPSDWERTYGHPIYFLETFVDLERHRGTCYRAANWVVMGRTTGRGKNCPNKRPNRSIKEVLGYPLMPRFREWLVKVE